MMKNMLIIFVGVISLLVCLVLNKKSIPKSIRNKIYLIITITEEILMFLTVDKPEALFILSSFIGLSIGWFIKDIWNKKK